MNKNLVSNLISKVNSFPPLPSVATRVMEITAAPDSSIEDLIEVIALDPSLTSTILKLSNSAFFGQVRKIGTLKQAVCVLGMSEIQNVVVAKAIFNGFRALNTPKKVFDTNDFWMHSFVCGLSARLFSTPSGLSPENLFISGLIHDIGKLVILMTFPDELYTHIRSNCASPWQTYKSEKKVLGASHAEIGLVLLKRWMFPDELVTAVGFHHAPDKAEENKAFPAAVHLADLLAHADKICRSPESDSAFEETLFDQKTVDIAAAVNIKWNRDTLEKYLAELKKTKEDAKETFSLLLS